MRWLANVYRTSRKVVRSIKGDDRIRPILKIVADFEQYAIGLLLVTIVGILIFDIAVRNLPGISFSMSWRNDIVIGLFIWMAWIGMAWGVKQDTHFRFLLVRGELSNRLNYLVYWIEWVIWVVFLGVVVRYSIPVMERWLRAGDIVGTSIPRYFLYLAVPVGFSLTLLRVGTQAVSVSRRYAAGESITPTSSIKD